MKRRICTSLLFVALIASAQQPRFSFAVFADIQYGDQPTAGKREYRKSPGKLQDAVAALNGRGDLAFAIQLGDLIDSKASDLDSIHGIYDRLATRKYHVLGNHDFSMPREPLVSRLGMPAAYYHFGLNGWRFVVLDGMDISVSPGSRAVGSPIHLRAQQALQLLRQNRAANGVDWNGAIGDEQIAWLRGIIQRATQNRERIILFCHFPILRGASTPAHLLWNHEELLRLIEGQPAVAGWFNGHDHAGGYAERNGIHHVTFPGMVESGERNSYTVVKVFADRLELEGVGSAPSRTLPLALR